MNAISRFPSRLRLSCAVSTLQSHDNHQAQKMRFSFSSVAIGAIEAISNLTPFEVGRKET